MSTRYHATILDHLAEFMLYVSTASLFWFSLNSAYGHSINSGEGNGGVGGGGGGRGGGEGGGKGGGSGCGEGSGGGGTARARAVFNNQLKGTAEVIMAVTTVTGSGYSCDNGDHGGDDDSGCGDCGGDTDHGSGGDGNTDGCSGGNGCNDGGSVGDSESNGRDGNSEGSVTEMEIAIAAATAATTASLFPSSPF
jgi:hypothetical protein